MTVLHSPVPQLIISPCEIPVAFFLVGLFRGPVSWYLPLSSMNARSCFWLLIWNCLLSGQVTENGGSEAVDLNKRSHLCTYNSHTAVCRDEYKNSLIYAGMNIRIHSSMPARGKGPNSFIKFSVYSLFLEANLR